MRSLRAMVAAAVLAQWSRAATYKESAALLAGQHTSQQRYKESAALLLSRMAEAAGDEVCSICQLNFLDDPDAMHLGCGHRFHKLCVETYMRIGGFSTIRDMPCPQCKLDAHELAMREQALLDTAVHSVGGSDEEPGEEHAPGEPAEPEEPEEPEAPEETEEPAVAGDKGKGKGQWQGQGPRPRPRRQR